MIDAVVVTHNTAALAVRCVRALLASTRPPDRIVVVDTGAEGLAEASAASVSSPAVAIQRLPGNPGYGLAANAGADRGTAPLILVANADTYSDPDALEYLADHLEEEPAAGCAGPALVSVDGAPQDAAFRFPGLAQAVLDEWPVPRWLKQSPLNGRIVAAERPVEIDHPLGAFMLLRRTAFEAVGGFSPAYRMYAEELDLCRRMKLAGWRIAHVPRARVTHVGGASARQMPAAMFEELYRSRARWYRTHATPGRARAAVAALWLGLAYRAAWPGPRQAAYRRALKALRRA